MASKNGTGRDARRIARREARLEEKMDRSGVKAAPTISPRVRNLLLLILGIVVVVLGIVWFIGDSRSYVATVDGRRIRNEEYQYFLKLQQSQVESAEGLNTKTEEERKAFWAQDAVDGENPILRVKNDALDTAKEYAIQLQKAKDMGLTVDEAIRAQAQSDIENIRQSLGENYNANLAEMGLTEARYTEILRNYYLIDVYRSRYLSENYQEPVLTDEEILAVYEADKNTYDTVSTRVIYLTETDAEGNALDEAALKEKLRQGEEILALIESGSDMEALAKERSESESAKDDGGMQDLSYSMQPYTPEIIDWAFAAEPGDATLLDTDYGIFVLRVEKRSGLEEAEAGIRTQMAAKAEADFYAAAVDGWMKEPAYNLILKEKAFERFTVE